MLAAPSTTAIPDWLCRRRVDLFPLDWFFISISFRRSPIQTESISGAKVDAPQILNAIPLLDLIRVCTAGAAPSEHLRQSLSELHGDLA